MEKEQKGEFLIYQSEEGNAKIEVRLEAGDYISTTPTRIDKWKIINF